MTRCRTTALVVTCLCFCGCGSSLRIAKFDPNKPQGLPFFVKEGVCVHQTIYATRYWRLTLKVTGESGVGTEEVLNISAPDHSGHDFNALLHELEKASPDSDSVTNAWTSLKRNQFDPWSQTEGQVVLDNSTALTSVVDYSARYSINVKRPLAGSASADFKLGPDGTLNEASGQIQDNTLSTIVSALPISTLVTSAAGIATKTGAAANEPAKAVTFSLTQEERYVKTIYSKSVVASDSICSVAKQLTEADQNISTSKSDVGASSNLTSGQNNDSNTITVAGTIKLPKPAPTPPTASSSNKNGDAEQNGANDHVAVPPSDGKKKN